ncbi:MAG: dTMP kinase [Methanomicrobiales archaeon]
MLITIEGIDGSGKSSLVSSLEGSLADLAPVMTREPGETWVGTSVRRAIAEEIDSIAEALLFVADHAVHLATVVRPALEKNQLVISDRYTDSRYAYQQVTLEGLVPDPLAWLRQVHKGWTISPDLTFLLVLPVDTALFRRSGRTEREHFEYSSLLTKVQDNYLALAREEPSRFILVDAEKDEKEIQQFVADAIRSAAARSQSRHRH